MPSFNPRDPLRPHGRYFLAQALRGARAYDGSEPTYHRAVDSIALFDQFVGRHAEQQGLSFDERGRAESWSSALLRRHGVGVTVDGLLDMAVEGAARRIASGQIQLKVERLDLVFLPSIGHRPIVPNPESVHPYRKPRLDPRVAELVAEFTRCGLHTDDMRIQQGRQQPDALRQESYTLISLPRYEREVLLCDEVGNASFVGKGLRGQIFWATWRKKELVRFDDVARVENRPGAVETIIHHIMNDNFPRPKETVGKMSRVQWTEDLLLVHGLRYAREHDWQMPNSDSGPVAGLPGQVWLNLNMALRSRWHGLVREEVTGLAHLWQIYGLKNGRTNNVEAIQAACARQDRGEGHGLVAEGIKFTLTEDRLLELGLRYAREHDWQMPGQHSGPVPGLPGQVWVNLQGALRSRSHGLVREEVTGLAHLWQIYGLKTGQMNNVEAIQAACARQDRGEGHGLVAEGAKLALTEDRLLELGLRHAREHHWQMPGQYSGPVPGLPGQAWVNLQGALRSRWHGLVREEVTGLAHLWQIYGLKNGRTNNVEAIQAACARQDRGEGHGLTPREPETVAEILPPVRVGYPALAQAPL